MKSPYSPDNFMAGLYEGYKSPYEKVNNAEDIFKVSAEIKKKAKDIFNLDRIPDKTENPQLIPVGKGLDYSDYTLQKYSVEIAKGLKMAVYLLTPKNIKGKAPAVVALCGHGYGVRHILGISKKGNKKILPYLDNYQKNFAVELCKRGCMVIAPELVGFGEAKLQKDLWKPFYISSCDELSHHLLPYGLTTASMRVYQTLVCADILSKQENVDLEKLSVMGISGGGLTALYSAVLDDRFKKIVISCYVNTFRDSILSLWHCPDNYIPHILNVGEIYDFASSLVPRKLLIESGKKDKLFPIDASKKAHSEIRRVYKLAGTEDNLQIDIFNGKHSVNGQKSFDFLAE